MTSLTSPRVMLATMAFELTSGVSPVGVGRALERSEAWDRAGWWVERSVEGVMVEEEEDEEEAKDR